LRECREIDFREVCDGDLIQDSEELADAALGDLMLGLLEAL
jgi:hypothetical protein